MKAAQLSRLDPATAAALLAGVHAHDPRGIATADRVQAIAQGGACFALTGDQGAQVVYVLQVRNGQCWIDAAQGQGGADLTRLALSAIELQASGLDSVAFQTARAGLVRKAQKCGYRVTGWILKKDLRR